MAQGKAASIHLRLAQTTQATSWRSTSGMSKRPSAGLHLVMHLWKLPMILRFSSIGMGNADLLVCAS
jgi:hypothetical protein